MTRRRLGTAGLVGVLLFTVSGGAYGLEPLVAATGARWAVALVLIVPLVWSVPIALMVAELASALPEEGGYYVWAREGLGEYWGVQEGWISVCYAGVDMALYPALFVSYLTYFVPGFASGSGDGSASAGVLAGRWLVALAVIGSALWLNLRGARRVGDLSLAGSLLVVLPFACLVLVAAAQPGAGARLSAALAGGAAAGEGGSGVAQLATGLSVVLWNYCGWDNVSTFAGEVERPGRAYPRALAIGLGIIVLAYLLPLLAGLSVTTDEDVWADEAGWTLIAYRAGGRWLGWGVAAAALVSAWSLFNAQLLYVARLPLAMAQDGWLPRALGEVSPRTGVPARALVAACLVAGAAAWFSFGELVVLDILLYSAALAIEFAALLRLRQVRPELPRPFRIPGGRAALWLVTLLPASCACAVLVVAAGEPGTAWQIAAVAAVVAGGNVVYAVGRRGRRRGSRTWTEEGRA